MPIDPETGLFSYGQPSYQPGSSSPAIGGLVSLLNAIQGQNLRQRALGLQQQQESEQVAKGAMSGIYDTPEGQAMVQQIAPNMTPEVVQNIVQSSPQNRLRRAFS